VLEIGTGSGYAAAILARLAHQVYTVERHPDLADAAVQRLTGLGFRNVSIRVGDGSLGWPEHAPYDAIAVSAGGPGVPRALLEQLAPGGRMVIPVGEHRGLQRLVRVTRARDGKLSSEDLGDVRFVPLVGSQGWSEAEPWTGSALRAPSSDEPLLQLIRDAARPLSNRPNGDLAPLLEQIGDARVVLIGEATHGTSEFHRTRAEITKQLILTRGFSLVAVEADWPDAAAVNHWVHGRPRDAAPDRPRPFRRFPTWLWRNHETREFVDWLREYNAACGERAPVSFHGLDLYSLFASIHAVIEHLDRVDPAAARVARERYACLSPWEADPAAYGRAAVDGRYRSCEREVVAMLEQLLARRLEHCAVDGDAAFDALQNARLVADAERYYRAVYHGAVACWNLRDTHMFETLGQLLEFHGPAAKVVVWEHNAHVGAASATELGARGQHSLGQLCRDKFGARAFLVGFGTDRGTVAAARDWGAPLEIMPLRPAHPSSYESLCHRTELPAFVLALRESMHPALCAELELARLQRAIGVVYRPETEVQSHYLHASLPRQFDAYVWFDSTRALRPIESADALPPLHPLGS
jgi:protein-L-isoaspartate(D-aspartate) O-methyltransferase